MNNNKKSSYRDLLAWKQAMDLVDSVYATTKGFPRCELFGLTAQMRNAAVSIPSNIAEGHGRWNLREFRRFLRTSRGSALELETQVLIAQRQQYLGDQEAESLLAMSAAVTRLIAGLIRYVDRSVGDLGTRNSELGTPQSSP